MKKFFPFLKERGITDLRDVTQEDIRAYYIYLDNATHHETGEEIAHETKRGLFTTVRMLFRSLYNLQLILKNPTEASDPTPSWVSASPRCAETWRAARHLRARTMPGPDEAGRSS